MLSDKIPAATGMVHKFENWRENEREQSAASNTHNRQTYTHTPIHPYTHNIKIQNTYH